MLRMLIVLLLAVQVPALAAPAAPAPAWSAESLLDLDAVEARERIDRWRAEASRVLQATDAALWAAGDDAERSCRLERRQTTRRFLDALDTFGPTLASATAAATQRHTAAGVLDRAWRPVAAVEPTTPCSVPTVEAGQLEITSTAPPWDGLAELPEVLEDDPMRLGVEGPGARLLRR